MEFLQILLCTVTAYLLGSIPSTIWISKFFYGINLREHGDGTATHNNMLAVVGAIPSLAARALDIAKGLAAARLALFFHHRYGFFGYDEFPVLTLAFGLAAVLGHIFPILANFQGGKGYHCSLGVFLAFSPLGAGISVALALLMYRLFRYPNLSHVVGALALPVVLIIMRHAYADMLVPVTVFSLSLFLMLSMTHRELVLKLIRGEQWVDLSRRRLFP